MHSIHGETFRGDVTFVNDAGYPTLENLLFSLVSDVPVMVIDDKTGLEADPSAMSADELEVVVARPVDSTEIKDGVLVVRIGPDDEDN